VKRGVRSENQTDRNGGASMPYEDLCPACNKVLPYEERDGELLCSACGRTKSVARKIVDSRNRRTFFRKFAVIGSALLTFIAILVISTAVRTCNSNRQTKAAYQLYTKEIKPRINTNMAKLSETEKAQMVALANRIITYGDKYLDSEERQTLKQIFEGQMGTEEGFRRFQQIMNKLKSQCTESELQDIQKLQDRANQVAGLSGK
jgi:archaellum component FlaF (FlaF/FlaG flagellin family)